MSAASAVPELSLVVPVKEVGEVELARLVQTARDAPPLEVVAVGKVSAARGHRPDNLRVVDRDCRIYEAMNLGAQAARGRYTLFMGIDDRLIGSNVEGVIAALSGMQADLVILPFRVGNRLVTQSFAPKELRSFHHQGVLFHRDTLLEVGGYDQRYALHADLDLMFRIQRRNNLASIGLPLVEFAKGGMTTSGRHSYDSIRQFDAIYAAHGVNRLSLPFMFSVALLLWYRFKFRCEQLVGRSA